MTESFSQRIGDELGKDKPHFFFDEGEWWVELFINEKWRMGWGNTIQSAWSDLQRKIK